MVQFYPQILICRHMLIFILIYNFASNTILHYKKKLLKANNKDIEMSPKTKGCQK